MRVLELILVAMLVAAGLFVAAVASGVIDEYLISAGLNVAEWQGYRIFVFFTIWLAIPILGILVLHRFTNLLKD